MQCTQPSSLEMQLYVQVSVRPSGFAILLLWVWEQGTESKVPRFPRFALSDFEATCYQAFQVSWCRWFVLQNGPRVQFALQCLMAVEFPHSQFTLRLYMILLPTHH